MERILLLGEGNFSFTKSLFLALSAASKDSLYQITSSSYDSQDSLIEKYPEVKSVLSYLRSQANITVKHNVDALSSLSEQLSSFSRQDYVIFNFPHIGKEDCHLHKSFLGHLLHRVKEILSPGGLFYLSLAGGQAENWSLSEMTTMQGFHIAKTFSFVPEDFPFYQMKRHQVGKSFKQRILSHQTFILTEKSDDNCNELSFSGVKQDIFQLMSAKSFNLETKDLTPTQQREKQQKPKKAKKRKMVELTAGKYDEVKVVTGTDSGSAGSSISVFRCLPCSKQFPTEQGVRTHVYTEHVLEKTLHVAKYQLKALETTGAQATGVAKTNMLGSLDEKGGQGVSGDDCGNSVGQYRCSLCGDGNDKLYSSVDALYQHVTAKHHSAEHVVNPPTCLEETCSGADNVCAEEKEFNVPSPTSGSNCEMIASEECLICGMVISSLADHVASLKPPEIQCIECTTCGRLFQSERSIQQHSRFCVLVP